MVDKSQRVIAEMGSLKQAQQALTPTQQSLLERIKAHAAADLCASPATTDRYLY